VLDFWAIPEYYFELKSRMILSHKERIVCPQSGWIFLFLRSLQHCFIPRGDTDRRMVRTTLNVRDANQRTFLTSRAYMTILPLAGTVLMSFDFPKGDKL
jgi:hypothetical protein